MIMGETNILNKYSIVNIITQINSKAFNTSIVYIELLGKVSIVKAISDKRIKI